MSNDVATTGAVRGAPLFLLRTEGAAMLTAAAIAYHATGAGWWVFAGLFLVPDLGMLGYLKGPVLGSALYNAAHTYVVPAALLAGALWLGHPIAQAVALVWIAHIGFDRMVGYGLKYPVAFNATHLGRVGGQGRV
ncbi:DUF4260 domain-containing protein [Nostoc sp. NIES-2111]